MNVCGFMKWTIVVSGQIISHGCNPSIHKQFEKEVPFIKKQHHTVNDPCHSVCPINSADRIAPGGELYSHIL